MRSTARGLWYAAWFVSACFAAQCVLAEQPSDRSLLDCCGVSGGLWVQVTDGAVDGPAQVAKTGRYLVQLLHPDKEKAEHLKKRCAARSTYGLISIVHLAQPDRLPYTENLINVLVIGQCANVRLKLDELHRVLAPFGALLIDQRLATKDELQSSGFIVADQSAGWLHARKPWPKEMDQWPQPRRGADNNTVSNDALVGPPDRVRWIAGPPQEISNMVTAAGRNYYGGVLVRDSFNGLRLWTMDIKPSPARGGYTFGSAKSGVRPIAAGSELLVFHDDVVAALDGATGRTLRTYPEAGNPTYMLHDQGVLLSVGRDAIYAVDLADGRLRWKRPSSEPRWVVAGDGNVYFLEGEPRRGEKAAVVAVKLDDGSPLWRRDDLEWLNLVRNLVYHRGSLACEISTLNNDKPNNRIELLAAADGKPLWNHTFIPGMAHMKQARAMFTNSYLWVLDDHRCTALAPLGGDVVKQYPAGWGHCFPPSATQRFLFSGEMDLTDLESGNVVTNPITKGSCGRDAGYIPANGLIYTAPKHCICWPILRDYTALAAAAARPAMPGTPQPAMFPIERGDAESPQAAPSDPDPKRDWPCYRHDAWRSGSTAARVPVKPEVLWQTSLGGWPEGPIADDWRVNSFVRGPVSPPVIAGGLVYVSRADAHQVVAISLVDGKPRWTFTADGRVDTPPTLHRGLCLFGARSGMVYCLRADNGRLVWRLRAAPADERIVAYGQVESPWPVAGSALVLDDVVYFAAGRQSLADGGILIFAVEPASGAIRWIERLNTVPQTQFYASSGLEFDNYDLLHREGDDVAMSRWVFARETGKMTCKAKSGFVRMSVGAGSVMAPRGCWSYAPRNETERMAERPFLRAPTVFRGNRLYSCTEDRRQLFRRDFNRPDEKPFNEEWYQGWSTYENARKGGDLWRSQRLAHEALWTVTPMPAEKKPDQVNAMLLTADALFAVSSTGGLAAISPDDGRELSRSACPAPVWDGLAAVDGRLVLVTVNGNVLCFGAK